jgi:hypothetical protein
MISVPIPNNVASSNPSHGEVSLPILIFFGADLKSKMAATAEHSLT